jgi:hypothetical protein
VAVVLVVVVVKDVNLRMPGVRYNQSVWVFQRSEN